MGQCKQTPCQRCGKPAYGQHCRACSFAVKPFASRVGTTDRTSWWVGLNGEFYTVARQEAQRMVTEQGPNYTPREHV